MNEREIAEFIHNEYENAAAYTGWKTQETCRVPFDKLPGSNRRTMLIVAEALKKEFDRQKNAQLREIIESVPLDQMSGGGNWRRILEEWKAEQLKKLDDHT